ncbi:autotransporter assembly complex family protein [Oceanicaulis sp. MMSF_3324]|uniref:autotransporter assembly complex protein TamA n=1 Tax=Oceanicaulis sp. MMSF_3324 TaxID=3046702 RepID=UPI00273F29FD|nr:BamA/TamA family outer membrane protein [Oceanicaulis sp. MMSF_3324]
MIGLRALLLLAGLTLTASAHGQSVNLTESEDPALQNALQSLIDERTKAGATNTRASSEQLVRYLRSEGYYTARVIVDQSEDAPVYQVTAGERFHFTAVSVQTGGQSDARSVARQALPIEVGDPVRAEAVLNAETEALRALRNSGWPDAQLEDRTITVDHADASGDAVFVYAPGAESLYGDIVLESGRWRETFIRRLAPFQPGERVSASQMRSFESRLEALQSMSSAAVTLEAPDEADGPQRRAVRVSPSPAPRHVAEAGFSLSTSEGGGVSGAYERRNLFGGDETLDINLNLATVQSGLQVELTAPHWRRLGQALTLEARAEREETDAYDLVEAGVGARVSRPITDALTVSLGSDLSVSHSENATLDLNVYTGSVSLGAVWDQRDSAIAPSQGHLVSMEVSPTVLAGDATSTYFRTVAEGRTYQRLTSSLIIAGRLRAGGLIGAPLESLPPEQRFFAGGGGSARGYEYQSLSPRNAQGDLVGGRSIVESSVELRWRQSRRWGGVLFVDSAAAGRDETPDFGAVRSAVGLGVRYYLDFAPVRFDVATPLDANTGDADIQVYIGLGEAF